MLGPARLGAADRVPADEPRRAARGGADRALGRADVGDRAPSALAASTASTCAASWRDRRRDDGQLGAGERLLERARRLVDRAALDGARERVRVRIPADDASAPAALRGEADRGADQPGADDREPLTPVASSARAASARRARNARSSDWRAFRRGSQSVS